MRIGFIGDIHGNLPALEAVFTDLHQKVDAIWCHGDICYGGRWPRECAQLVRSACQVITRGNTDDLIAQPELDDPIAQRDRLELGDDLSSWLRSLPVEHAADLILTHATRRSNAARLPHLEADDNTWQRAFGPAPATIVCGHNHVAFRRDVGADLHVLNTGSVGAPFDGDPRASYLVGTVERGMWSFAHWRAEYPREQAARALDDLGHREARRFAYAIRTGRHP
jgi:predicted phosphodiesterase